MRMQILGMHVRRVYLEKMKCLLFVCDVVRSRLVGSEHISVYTNLLVELFLICLCLVLHHLHKVFAD